MMRSWQWFQKCLLATSFLIGGLVLAPVQSEAVPTLTIDGVSVGPLTQVTCPSGYNLCYSIPNTATGARYGNWIVKDVSTTNKARVLINDVSTAGSIDAMKFSGVTLTPVVTSGTKTATVVISNVYNNGGGNPAGDYYWAMGMGGYFDPPSSENVVNNRLKLGGGGNFSGSLSLGALDTGTFTTSTINDVNGSVTRSLSAKVVKPACDTGGGRCAPTITYTFTITVAGADTLVLNDSVIGGGGTCREEGPVPDVPPGTPDPLPPGPVCRGFANHVNQLIHEDMIASQKSAKAADAVVVETCVGGCGNGTIIIRKEVDDSPDGTFGFSGTGEDIPTAFDITTASGTGSVTYSNVATDVTGGVRTITETVFPSTDEYHFWQLDDVTCVNTGGENGTNWIRRYEGEYPYEVLTGVKVLNLENGDTLTCTFRNSYHYSD